MEVWHSGCEDEWRYGMVGVGMWHSECGDGWRYGIVGVAMSGVMA